MSKRIRYEGHDFECRDGETVLDALLRHGQNPPFSCRSGSCLVCLQRCVAGSATDASQRALKSSLQRAGYFLPCKCKPAEDMELAPPRAADLFTRAVIQRKRLLARDVCELQLETATSLYYHAGQFVNVRRTDGLTRSYSLASLPTEDEHLTLHVKRLAGGAMTSWIFDELAEGDEVELQGPNGRCYYVPGSQDQDLLLIGNGTGVAPLVGIVRDALHVGHRAWIRLFHGSRSAEGLYLHEELTRLEHAHPNFDYVPCVSGPDIPDGMVRGRAHHVAFAHCTEVRHWRVFAAGLPQLVAEVESLALRAGVDPTHIHTDPYIVRNVEPPTPVAEGTAGRARAPATSADREMWQALGEGTLLAEILTDFYTRVFEDAVLAPYFRGVTKERLIGQVFSFMRDAFAGERLYFGMRPRTAHHWMVISDEIFDHRERLMETCLREHGLPEHLVQRWRRFEEGFRADIVKDTPWKLVIDGIEMPLDGFGEEELSVGTLCDGCERAVDAGERVRYHLRLGLTYCAQCTFDHQHERPAGDAQVAHTRGE